MAVWGAGAGADGRRYGDFRSASGAAAAAVGTGARSRGAGPSSWPSSRGHGSPGAGRGATLGGWRLVEGLAAAFGFSVAELLWGTEAAWWAGGGGRAVRHGLAGG